MSPTTPRSIVLPLLLTIGATLASAVQADSSFTIEVATKYAVKRPGGPLEITMKVNGKEVATTTTVNGHEVTQPLKLGALDLAPKTVPVSAPLLFTANDCFDIGIDLGSPVSLDYFNNASFKFNGKIENVHMEYIK